MMIGRLGPWSIARWSISKLDPSARERMQTAWSSALDAVASDGAFAESALAVLGFPSREEQAALANELRPLWTSLLAA